MEYLSENYRWLFSGIGVVVLGWIFHWWTSRNSIAQTFVAKKTKDNVRILFIDDDVRFKVVKILKTSGWVHTKLVKDVVTLSDNDLMDASIVFVDVQGVGKLLDFQEEGLGLASAIKKNYPDKKVVIYSAETKGDRFHEALREADSFLSKNADPYEFQQTLESLVEELNDES
ncbi:MAG: response regulator [Gammaproteobacteria bacterium]|nr:MAG: response regulator [Gammaproteobacteria bacterium]